MRVSKQHAVLLVALVVGCGSPARASSAVTPAVSQLAAGASHTCVVTEQGRVACWGSNVDGQLGDGSTEDRSTPAPVLGVENALGVASGSYHACALLADGTAQCWGWNSYGQVGAEASIASTTATPVAGLERLIGIAAGGYHSCALDDAGKGSAWGQNDLGQLGDGGTRARATPAAVFSLPKSAAIAAGGRHSCALVKDGFHDGTVQCWGANGSGELGDGSTEARAFPVPVVGITDAVAISAGFTHSCALRANGEVACWGANDHGELGDGGQSGAQSAIPVKVAGLTATRIATGYNHSCALASDGKVACWGANAAAQLGDGTTMDRFEPTPVLGLSQATALAGGAFHTCALTREHGVSCWGLNDSGQLGDGTTAPHALPAPILGLP